MTSSPPEASASDGPQRLGEEWLMQIAENIREMLWVWEPSGGQVTYVNPAFEQFWGFGAAEAAGAGGGGAFALLEHVHAEDRERLRARRLAVTHTGYDEEFRVHRPPSATRTGGRQQAWLRERAFPVHAGDGTLLRITHIATDVSWQFDTTAQLRAEISRRTDAERNLSDVTARLQTLIDTANDAVVTIDDDSIIMDWNATATRMFGWQRQETIGRTLTDFIVPPEHRAAHHAGLTRYLKSGQGAILNRRIETTAVRRDGQSFDVELSVWPVRVGDRWTFSSFIRDISGRKAAERALAESEAKYRRVVENVNEGIIVTAGGRILYSNPRALELTGLDADTATTKPFIEFIHPDDRALVYDNHVRRLRGEPVPDRYHFRALHVSGDIRWLETSGVAFEWQGAPATLNFLTDVTLKRQVEQDIRSALERERELSELKSRFVAVASHEFRTPLAAILSSVELLDDYGESIPPAERKEILGLVKTAVKRMNGMVEQVLVTSRLESGGFGFEPRPLPVVELLSQIVAEVDQAHSRKRRVILQCTALDDMRSVDERLLRHILANLLGNAAKYSAADAAIECAASGEGDLLALRITDHGIGIPAADLPRLFESFHRGTNVGNIQGTGIGLHIVKECVDLHRGTIEVDSTLGQGSTFRVLLHAPPVRERGGEAGEQPGA